MANRRISALKIEKILAFRKIHPYFLLNYRSLTDLAKPTAKASSLARFCALFR